jgi:hypothetical protein
MAMLDVVFRKSPRLVAAEQRLREREDEVFKMQPGEDTNLATHVHVDLPRHELLRGRIELAQAFSKWTSDRNLTFTIAGFAIILAKLFGVLDVAWATILKMI